MLPFDTKGSARAAASGGSRAMPLRIPSCFALWACGLPHRYAQWILYVGINRKTDRLPDGR